jgi:NADH-quinone oxidoreductase subunit E
MLRRLHPDQPDSFAFTPANLAWAEARIAQYPEGRQASAIIPLLWRAQEQEGWLTRPAIEHVADMLGMARIRALEVATFYFMFQLSPVGSVAHVQVCGTTPCMLCGSDDLIAVCRDRIAAEPHRLSPDGRFSWEEVECLGACANAPMAQIGKDYYEDLTPDSLTAILDALAAGETQRPGSQAGRFASEPAGGTTSLADTAATEPHNAAVALALAEHGAASPPPSGPPDRAAAAPLPDRDALPGPQAPDPAPEPMPARDHPADETGVTRQEAPAQTIGRPEPGAPAAAAEAETGARTGATPMPVPVQPPGLAVPRGGVADDLTRIDGLDPGMARQLAAIGIHHFGQIAAWTLAEIAWVEDNLDGARGRVARERWVAQARRLAGAAPET